MLEDETVVNVVVTGSSGIGKTNMLLNYFDRKRLLCHYSPTVMDQYKLSVSAGGSTFIDFSIVECGGQATTLLELALRTAHFVLLCFSVDCHQSLNASMKSIKDVQRICPRASIVLVGLKCDLRSMEDNTPLVSRAYGEYMASTASCAYFEASSLCPETVSALFRYIVKTVCTRPPLLASKPALTLVRRTFSMDTEASVMSNNPKPRKSLSDSDGNRKARKKNSKGKKSQTKRKASKEEQVPAKDMAKLKAMGRMPVTSLSSPFLSSTSAASQPLNKQTEPSGITRHHCSTSETDDTTDDSQVSPLLSGRRRGNSMAAPHIRQVHLSGFSTPTSVRLEKSRDRLCELDSARSSHSPVTSPIPPVSPPTRGGHHSNHHFPTLSSMRDLLRGVAASVASSPRLSRGNTRKLSRGNTPKLSRGNTPVDPDPG
mmetsp:Transcript_24415/g.61231  ORF Transcript_24415/g.61231 Transcript_24415/m.61231 type:complete len:429 (+) Transcript_24415:349-1635(+)